MKKLSISFITLFLIITILTPFATAADQPVLEGRAVDYIYQDGLQFKDLNKNGILDTYEDWRASTEDRVADLLSQMTLEEKAGMMLIDTLNAEIDGRISDKAVNFVEDQKMTRFIFRNPITAEPKNDGNWGWGGPEITPYQAAQYMNNMQELAESQRLGIPALFKSNARNHYDSSAKAGINVSAGSFSEWPKEAGLAATRDMDLIAEFAQTMRSEWNAIGLRSMYGYMADLATEPRWYRIHETFTEDADLAAEIMTVLVENLQGKEITENSIVLTMKHFPGGGPQEGGGDPHYDYGKNQIYPTDMFDYHVKPFKAAIDAGLTSIMPYYGIPVDQDYDPNDVGMAFSRGIVTDLLRDELGFEGYVNSDTGIIGDRAWGLEDKNIDEQLEIAIKAGTDVLSGFNDKDVILDLIEDDRLSEERVETSVKRLLTEQFELGLFENPYVNPDRAAYLVGNRVYQRKAEKAQRKSIVMLENKDQLLPINQPSEDNKITLYTMGMNPNIVSHENWNNYNVIDGNYNAEAGETLPIVPNDTHYAIIRVNVTNQGAGRFGGSTAEEMDMLSFSQMAEAESWVVSPSLEDINTVMDQVGAENTILSIYFRQPFVIDQASSLRDAGALLGTFGVRDAAVMDIITGNYNPQGKLPFALASNEEAIIDQNSDEPGYDLEDTLYPFGFGMTYPK